jgi:hypothetical protein
MKKLLFIIIFYISACMNNEYSPFIPLTFEKDKFVAQQPSPVFYNNLKLVLDLYQEDYKIDDNGVILIHQQLKKDLDLIRNYTNKANDLDWLKANTLPKK